MKVFISWSGDLSNKIAIILKDWIPNVIQNVEPYVSSEDIPKGDRWSTDIAKELSDSSFGILCVTKDNVNAPWLNFEAGALSKKLDSSKVCPFLFGMKKSEIEGPLLQFQITFKNMDDIFKLMQSINKSSDDESLDDTRLKNTFDVWWPSLEEALNKVEIEIPEIDVEIESEDIESEDIDANNLILEEILDLVRTQQKLLRRPEEILPPSYLYEIIQKIPDRNSLRFDVIEDLYNYYGILGEDIKSLNSGELDFKDLKQKIDETYEDYLKMAGPIKYFRRNARKNQMSIKDRVLLSSF